MIDIDQGHSGASSADREGFQHLVAEVSLGRAGIVLGLECSRLARNNADWHQLLQICAHNDTLILDEDGLYDPTSFNDRLLLGMKGQLSEAELHFLRARLRGGILSKARRGELQLSCRSGWPTTPPGTHPGPRHRRPRRIGAAIRHLHRHRVGVRLVKAFSPAQLTFPCAAPRRTPQGELYWKTLHHHVCCGSCTTPATPARYSTAGPRQQLPGGNHHTLLPRGEWIAFIPGAHPGYITWPSYQANLARPGRQRRRARRRPHSRARPRGTRPAPGHHHLRQLRAADDHPLPHPRRPHHRAPPTSASATASATGADLPAPPRHSLDTADRAAAPGHPHPAGPRSRPHRLRRARAPRRDADALRAAHVQRARTPPTRPGAATSPSTPPTGWSPTPSKPTGTPRLRALPTPRTTTPAAKSGTGQSPTTRKARIRALVADFPAHLERPRHPDPGTQAHRPAAAHRRHPDPHQRHHHRRTSACPAASTTPSPSRSR